MDEFVICCMTLKKCFSIDLYTIFLSLQNSQAQVKLRIDVAGLHCPQQPNFQSEQWNKLTWTVPLLPASLY